jgi:hypothetical protein
MAANNTVAYNEDQNNADRNVVRLAAITTERTFYPTGSETELRLETLETSLTARVANDTARLAHFDAFETN